MLDLTCFIRWCALGTSSSDGPISLAAELIGVVMVGVELCFDGLGFCRSRIQFWFEGWCWGLKREINAWRWCLATDDFVSFERDSRFHCSVRLDDGFLALWQSGSSVLH